MEENDNYSKSFIFGVRFFPSTDSFNHDFLVADTGVPIELILEQLRALLDHLEKHYYQQFAKDFPL